MGFWSFLFGKKEIKDFKLVVLGLDGAGKLLIPLNKIN